MMRLTRIGAASVNKVVRRGRFFNRIDVAVVVDHKAVRSAAFMRRIGATLLGGLVGANRVCDKADTCRTLPGMRFIPMLATGHTTMYDWCCVGRRAAAGKVVKPIDTCGYIAGN